MTAPDRAALAARLKALRRKHHVCDEDCWYTCAAATDERDGGHTCDDARSGKPCDCGADKFNAETDSIVAALLAAPERVVELEDCDHPCYRCAAEEAEPICEDCLAEERGKAVRNAAPVLGRETLAGARRALDAAIHRLDAYESSSDNDDLRAALARLAKEVDRG